MTCWRCSASLAEGAPGCPRCGAASGAPAPPLARQETAAGAVPPGWREPDPGGWPAAPQSGWGAPPPDAWGPQAGPLPAYVPAGPPWAPPVDVPTSLATALSVALVVSAVVDSVAALLGARYASALGRLIDGAPAVDAVGIENAYAAVGGVQLLVLLTTGVLFLVWFSRIDAAARQLGVAGIRHSHGWAVGSWFVPFLNLIRPKQMVDDAWRVSDPVLPPGAHREAAPGVPGWITLWWVLWVVGNIVGFRAATFSTELEAVRTSAVVGVVSDLVFVVAAVLAALLVRRLTGRLHAAVAARR